MSYKEFPESFLKTIIKGPDGDINVGNEDYYEVYGLKDRVNEFLNKGDNDEITELKIKVDTGLNPKTGKREYKTVTVSKVRALIRKMFQPVANRYHPDRNLPQDKEWANRMTAKLMEAKKVLEVEAYRKEYDKIYKEVINDNLTVKFKNDIKQKLNDLSEYTDPTAGAMGLDQETSEGEHGKRVDVRRWKHLFPSNDFINRKLNSFTSKKIASRFANWVVFVYGKLRPLQTELWGEGNLGKKKIDKSQLGAYQNFKEEILKKETYDDIDNYVEEVRKKIIEIKKTSGGENTIDIAHEVNYQRLRGLEGWDLLSGEENTAYTEKYQFITGYIRKERGIYNIKSPNPDYQSYKEVIEKAKLFIRYKKRVMGKVGELKAIPGFSKLRQITQEALIEKLEKLGQLEKVHETYKKWRDGIQEDVQDLYMEMKFNEYQSDELDEKIKEVFDLAKEKINSLGGEGGNSKPNEDQIKQNAAIAEIRQVLEDNRSKGGFSQEFINNGKWIKEVEARNGGDIETYKQEYLNKIYRTVARKEVEKKLNGKLASTVLKINNLADHFKSFQGEGVIEAEKNRLLILIDDYKNNKDKEIKKAKDLVRDALKTAGLEGQVKEVLGNNWENEFLGLVEDSEIDGVTDKLIQKISHFVDLRKQAIKAAITQIENFLKDSGLTESILESNWKNCFDGKNQLEINKEVECLRGVIMAENQKKDDDGGKNKNDKILTDSKVAVLNQVKAELKKGHQKLILEEKDLPVSLFAPHKTLNEKLNSLEKSEDITAFNNNLLVAIEREKNKKLRQIAQRAVAEIDQMIEGGNSWELGELKDYKNIILNSNDPDDIERKKNNVKKLITEQKQARENDEVIEDKDANKRSLGSPKETPLLKVIGIAALVVLPLALIIAVKIRLGHKNSEREREVSRDGLK